MSEMPSFVTHYYDAARQPFLHLSDLSEEHLVTVLAGLTTPEQQAVSQRRFEPRYMALRRATEARARDLFIAAGGTPERAAPHYFVLGSGAWFAGLYRDVAEVRLPLADLPVGVTSATWADSITALGLGVPMRLPVPQPAHAERLYRLEELEDLIAVHGLPEDRSPAAVDGCAGHQHRPVDSYIEVQLWSDEPVRHHLSAPPEDSP